MSVYEEAERLKQFATAFREFQKTRDLMELEDLDVYIYTIKNRFFEKSTFPEQFAEGYELIRKEAEKLEKQTKKYSREKYF